MMANVTIFHQLALGIKWAKCLGYAQREEVMHNLRFARPFGYQHIGIGKRNACAGG